MTNSNNRVNSTLTYRERSAARRAARQKRMICRLVFICGLICLLAFGIASTVSAMEQPKYIKMVTSIVVEPGDTLWTIAEDHMSDGYEDIASFIQEIQDCNQMFDEEIRAGENLIIPYYVEADSRS